MALYRAEAERLQEMLAEVPRPGDPALAIRALTDAVAHARSDEASRRAAEHWLGPLPRRLDILDAAIASTATLHDPGLRRSVLLDVVEQADGVALVAAYDAIFAERDADRLRRRAAALRHRGASQSTPVEDEVQALRLEQQAELAELEASAARSARNRAREAQVRALRLLQETP